MAGGRNQNVFLCPAFSQLSFVAWHIWTEQKNISNRQSTVMSNNLLNLVLDGTTENVSVVVSFFARTGVCSLLAYGLEETSRLSHTVGGPKKCPEGFIFSSIFWFFFLQ